MSEIKYTIKFSYAGYNQYCKLIIEDNIVKRHEFYIQYNKGKNIDLKSKTLDEAIELIKSISYCNEANIHLINDEPAFLYEQNHIKEAVKLVKKEYDKFIEEKIEKFFNDNLVSIIRENEWRITVSNFNYIVLIAKKDNEWDNYHRVIEHNLFFKFEYLCYLCLKALDLEEKIELKNETYTYYDYSCTLLGMIPNIDKSEFFLNPNVL